jgi:LuxR family maltose regulon positive regulatory protein
MIQFKGLPIIRTKIMIPALRARMVHRPRLLAEIERGLTEEGFILVSAPAGYGKTTLVSEWAQQSQHPVAWLSLDEHDNELMAINRYLTTLAESRLPQLKIDADNLPPAGNPEEEFHNLLISIINGSSELSEPYTVVVDDYQVIQNPQIHAGLALLLDNKPPQMGLIVISRTDPPIPLARLRANHRILEINSRELEFSLAEAMEFLHNTMQCQLEDSRLHQIVQLTQGWVTGLQLIALAQHSADKSHPTGSVPQENQGLLQQYIIEEIIRKQPAEVQDFLRRTAVLDNLCAPLCDAVLDPTGQQKVSQSILDTLSRANLLITALDNEGKWFHYHPLLKEALQRLLSEQSPEETKALHLRASEWCDQNELYEEALNHTIAAGDYPRVVSLLEKYSLHVQKNGDILDLLRWVKKVPTEAINDSPLLFLIYAWGMILSFEMDSGEFWTERASNLLEERTNQEDRAYVQELRGVTYAAQSILAAVRGEGERSIELSRQALELLPEANSFAHCFVLLDQGVTYSLNSELTKAVEILQEAIRLSQTTGNWMVLMIARIFMGDVLINCGKLSQALNIFKQTLSAAAPGEGKSTGFEGMICIETGEIHLLRNELNEAAADLQRSISLEKSWLPMLYELDAHLKLTHLHFARRDFAAAAAEIKTARSLAEISQGSLDDLFIDIYEAKYALLRGDASLALQWLQKNALLHQSPVEFCANLPFSFGTVIQLLVVRCDVVLFRQQKEAELLQHARSVLDPLLERLQSSGYVDALIEADLLLAEIEQEEENNEACLMALQNALALAEPEQYRQNFLDEGLPMARLLTTLLAAMKHGKIAYSLTTRSFVTDLLFRLTGQQDEASAEAHPNTPSPDAYTAPIELLTPREMEVLRLAASGRTNQEIAAELSLSVNTVKRHLNNIFLKLGATTRTQAIALAHQQGWLH